MKGIAEQIGYINSISKYNMVLCFIFYITDAKCWRSHWRDKKQIIKCLDTVCSNNESILQWSTLIVESTYYYNLYEATLLIIQDIYLPQTSSDNKLYWSTGQRYILWFINEALENKMLKYFNNWKYFNYRNTARCRESSPVVNCSLATSWLRQWGVTVQFPYRRQEQSER